MSDRGWLVLCLVRALGAYFVSEQPVRPLGRHAQGAVTVTATCTVAVPGISFTVKLSLPVNLRSGV